MPGAARVHGRVAWGTGRGSVTLVSLTGHCGVMAGGVHQPLAVRQLHQHGSYQQPHMVRQPEHAGCTHVQQLLEAQGPCRRRHGQQVLLWQVLAPWGALCVLGSWTLSRPARAPRQASRSLC